MRKYELILAAALFMSVAATSCFTGVETTPKITDSDVRRDLGAPLPEDGWLADVEVPPLEKWPQGMAFVVTDNRAALAFNSGALAAGGANLVGQSLRFVDARGAVDVAGRRVTDIVLADSLGERYVYRVESPIDTLRMKRPSIPFTIPQMIVDTVARRMRGNTYYILTSVWRDSRGQAVKAHKFVPVEVLDVVPGNDAYPVMVRFADANKVVGRVLMSVGPEAKRFRSFASLFSFSDPRLRHRSISDDVWRNIVAGRVAPGMTREECRLALGSPVEVIQRPGYSYLRETWRYESGIYLTFEDGILK